MLQPCLVLAESTVHTLDPFAIQFTESFGIRWYGLAYLTGFVAGWLITRWLAKRGCVPLTVAQVGDFITACVLGVVLGGRLGHILFYEPALLTTFHNGFPYWGVLDLHKGGMSSHGGMVGCILAMAWSAYIFRVPFMALCDTVCFIAPPGLMLGRLANWVNGELWGKVLPASMQQNPPFWSVKFPEEAILTAPTPAARAQAEHLYAMAYSGSAEAAQQIAQLVPARFPSQWFQAFTDGPVLMLVLVLVWLKPRHAGTLFGVFFITYGLLRILSEQFREPDAGVYMIGPVTLPMMLSGGMVLLGVGAWVANLRNLMVGGLLAPAGRARVLHQ